MPIQVVIDGDFIGIKGENGTELVYWGVSEWTQDPRVVYSMVHAIQVGYEHGEQALVEFLADRNTIRAANRTVPQLYEPEFSLTSATDTMWPILSSATIANLVPSTPRQIMQAASQYINGARNDANLSAVINTGGNIYCLLVRTSPSVEFRVWDAPDSWRMAVNDAGNGDNIANIDLELPYTCSASQLGDRILAHVDSVRVGTGWVNRHAL